MYIQLFLVFLQLLQCVISRPNIAGQGYKPTAFQNPTNPDIVNTFFPLTASTTRRKDNLSGIAPAIPLQKVRISQLTENNQSNAYRDMIGTPI